MTTKAAEARYLAEHLWQWEGRPLTIHNPHSRPLRELPVIYGWNNGGSFGYYSARLVAEDGTPLGGHCCSAEGYMPADLGIIEGSYPSRHETFRAHYPNGYRMEFVPLTEVPLHEGLQRAFGAARAKGNDPTA